MMSLFSSFDLFIFFKNWVSFFLIFGLSFCNIFLLTFNNNFFKNLFENLSLFFYSLKMKSFNKFSTLLFMSFIIFLGMMNFFSVFSFVFPTTSQVSLIFFFALSTWVSFIIFSLINSSKKFLYHLVPEGTPLPLTFLLFLIESVSSFIRPITLMVRLVANILAGHLLMILLSNLVFSHFYSFLFYILLNLVEIFVSLIQAYIFATMLVLYFSEV